MQNPIQIKAFLHSPSNTFTYVLSDPDTKLAVIIDPVMDFDIVTGMTHLHHAKVIGDWISEEGLTLSWILETHVHADHLSAASYFSREFGAKRAIGRRIVDVQRYFKRWYNLEDSFVEDGSQFDKLFDDDEVLRVGNLSIRALPTPGHTPADMTYVVNRQYAFVGDSLFMPDVGTARCDFPGGDAKTLYASIMRIYQLGDGVELYMCHDYPPDGRDFRHRVTVKEQKQSNIHVNQAESEASFVAKRTQRDASLGLPKSLVPAIQINVRAGEFPPAEGNGVSYIKVPLNFPLSK